MIGAQLNIEQAILSTCLQAENYWEEPFELEENLFLVPFNKRVAKLINQHIHEGRGVGLIIFLLEEKYIGTQYERDFLDIVTANTLPRSVAVKYMKELKIMSIQRRINAKRIN